LQFARFLKSILRRLESVEPSFHLVLHTTPNRNATFDKKEHWRTLEDDFHWHFEILPANVPKSTSYCLKEVFYNSLRPEQAADELRKAGAGQG
jgi:galactose-1-phosphate uridylyltransferase